MKVPECVRSKSVQGALYENWAKLKDDGSVYKLARARAGVLIGRCNLAVTSQRQTA